MHPLLRAGLAATASLLPAATFAHAFTQPYTLPVPFSLYAIGAGAALVLSFVIVGLFASVPSLARVGVPAQVGSAAAPERGLLLRLGRAVSLALLLLTIVSGLVGTQRALGNFNMTFFWIVFVLGVPYAVALLGDFYAAVNP